MSKIPIIAEKQLFEILSTKNSKYSEKFYAFYSSWFGGIIKNPSLMLIPIDDHLEARDLCGKPSRR